MTHPPATKASSKARSNGNVDFENDDELSLDVAPPPDGGWGWMVVLGSFMIHIVADGVTYSFGIFILEFTHYFNSGSGETAWIASILVGVTLCSGPLSGSLVNKYGCRIVTICGALLAGFCLCISVFATNIIFLYITVGVGTGLGFGLIYLPAIVSVTCYFEKLRSLATGIAVCGSGLGTFIFAPFTEWLITEFGWRGALLIIAGIVLNCTIFGALFRPLPEKRKKRVSLEEKKEIEMTILNDKKVAIKPPADWRHSVCKASDLPQPDGEWGTTTNRLLAPPVKQNSSSAQDVSKPPVSTSGHMVPGSHAARFLRSETARMAMSHPAQLNHQAPQKQRVQRPLSGVLLSRPDVFYRGSLSNIQLYRSTSRLPHDVEGSSRLRVDSPIPSHTTSRGLSEDCSVDDETCCGGVFSSVMLKEMLDLSLLKDPVFILFTVSNFCTSIGFNIPYVYIVAQAEQLGIASDQASYLLSVIGGANTIGRIILGYASDKTWVNRLLVYNVCLTICGLATMASVLGTDFTSLVLYGCVYGFTIGAYVGLTSVILVDLLGLEALTNAFGLLLLFQGIASFIGPPMAGWLYDGLKSYDPGFLLAGGTIAASGLMLFFIPALKRYCEKKNLQRT